MKPVILTFSRYYLPGFRAGGPIRSIANMVERLGDQFEFRIVTSDRDIGEREPYPGIQHGAWSRQGNAWVHYVSSVSFGLKAVADIIRTNPHDAIYLNSFFDSRFTQQVLINRRLRRVPARPVILAPRGEFASGALRLKRLKKRAYIHVARRFGLYADLVWQASSQLEAMEIQRALRIGQTNSPGRRVAVSGRVATASNLIGDDYETMKCDQSGEERVTGGLLRICFLSRISRMKNLDYALRVLARVNVPVRFSVYGPAEDAAYWAECQTLTALLPSHIEVVYEGLIEPAQVVISLAQHDLFLLPTRGENFGHVIYEALRAGLPLLISDRTPWQQLEEKGVGWNLPLADLDAFARKIEEVARWSQADFELATSRARALARKMANDPVTIDANRRLFLDALRNGARSTRSAAYNEGVNGV